MRKEGTRRGKGRGERGVSEKRIGVMVDWKRSGREEERESEGGLDVIKRIG